MLGNPGPFKKGKKAKVFGQQTSFHTQKAADLLDKGIE